MTDTLSVVAGWSLEAKPWRRLELLGQREQLPLLAGTSDELHSDGQSIVQTGGDRDRRRVREADREHELDVSPVGLAQEWGHRLDRHGKQAECRREQEVEAAQQWFQDNGKRGGAGSFESLEVLE